MAQKIVWCSFIFCDVWFQGTCFQCRHTIISFFSYFTQIIGYDYYTMKVQKDENMVAFKISVRVLWFLLIYVVYFGCWALRWFSISWQLWWSRETIEVAEGNWLIMSWTSAMQFNDCYTLQMILPMSCQSM